MKIEADCIVEIERSPRSLHAYAVPAGVEIRPGDEVLIHDPPTQVGYGGRVERACRITVRRAGPFKRAWVRATSILWLTELYEVGFEAGGPR